jgi:hypothetical protein
MAQNGNPNSPNGKNSNSRPNTTFKGLEDSSEFGTGTGSRGISPSDIAGDFGEAIKVIYERAKTSVAFNRAVFQKEINQIGGMNVSADERQRLTKQAHQTQQDKDLEVRMALQRDAALKAVTMGSSSNVRQEVIHKAQSEAAHFSLGMQQAGVYVPPNAKLESPGDYRRNLLLQSQEFLSSKRDQLQREMSVLREKDLAEAISKDLGSKRINEIQEKISEKSMAASTFHRAIHEQKTSGLTSSAILKRSQELQDRRAFTKRDEELREMAKTVDPKELENKLSLQYEELGAKKKKLTEAEEKALVVQAKIDAGDKSKQTANELENLNKTIRNVKDGLDKLNDSISESEKLQKYKDRQREQTVEKWVKGLNVAGQIARTVGVGAALYNEVGDSGRGELRKASALTNVINASNRQYFNAQQAIYGNDISAMADVINQDAAAKLANYNAEQQALKTQAVSGFFSSIVGGVANGIMLAAPSKKPNLIIASGVVGGITGGASAYSQLNDAFSGTAEMNERMQQYNTWMGLSRAKQAIALNQVQKYYSHNLDLYQGTRELGTGGDAVRKVLGDTATTSFLANTYGIDPSEARRLVPLLRSAGSFDENVNVAERYDNINSSPYARQAGREGASDAEMKQIKLASGYKETFTESLLRVSKGANLVGGMSMSEAFATGAHIKGMGGSALDFEQLMAGAVEAGLNNAKSISELVAATSDMSSELASQGISAYGGLQSSMLDAASAMGAFGMDKNLIGSASRGHMMRTNAMLTDTSYNLANLIEIDSIAKAFPNATLGQRSKIQSFGEGQLGTINKVLYGKGDEEQQKKAVEALRNMAIETGTLGVFFKDGGKGPVNKEALEQAKSSSMLGVISRFTNVGKNDIISKELMQLASMPADQMVEYLKGEGNYLMSESSDAVKFILRDKIAQGKDDPAQIKKLNDLISQKEQDVGAKNDKTKATTGASELAQGEENTYKYFAQKHENAMDAIQQLMTTISGTVIARGDELSKAAADTGKIVSTLGSGANKFEASMDAVIKKLRDNGIAVDVPPSKEKSLDSAPSGTAVVPVGPGKL